MAYRRRNFRRRTNNRRYRNRKRPNVENIQFGNVGSMSVSQAARYGAVGYNILKGLINSELKRYDYTATQNVTTTGSIVALGEISGGDDASNRDGNKVLAKYITFKYLASSNASAATTFLRVMMIVDTQNQGSAPSLSDILQVTTANSNIVSPINVDNTQRFTVLFDDHLNFSNTGSQSYDRKHYNKLNFHMTWTSTAGSAINKNAIFLVLVSTQGVNSPSITYSSRLAFYDN